MRSRWTALLPPLCGVLALGGCARQAAPDPANEARAAAPAAERVVRGQAPDRDKSDKGDKREVPSAEPFRFPADAGGAVAEKRLRPALPPETETSSGPHRRPAPRLDEPEPPLPLAVAAEPRLPPQRGPSRLTPRPLRTEETLDDAPEAHPAFVVTMAVGERVRTEPAPDVRQPAPLPPLATPVPDRASLEDPTRDAADAAASAATPPQRRQPVPFQRVSLPDPFENRRVIRPPALGPESVPAVTVPRP